MKPERRLKKRLAEQFKAKHPQGWYTSIRAGVGGQKLGMPDQYFADDGRQVWVESKILPNNLSESQARCINAMRLAGIPVKVLYACPKTGRLQLTNGGEGVLPRDVWVGQAFSPSFWEALFS